MIEPLAMPSDPRARFEAALRAPRSRHTYPLPTPARAGAPGDLHAAGGEAVLYLHVPFCTQRCTYCFFVTQIGHGADDMSRYVDEIAGELALATEALAGYRFAGLYYGGGTPGLLPASVFSELHGLVAPLLAPGATITVETHPHAADDRRVAAWRQAGVDRVSMGVQTTDPGLLALIKREQTQRHILPAVERLLDAGFDDVNVDLLYGLPQQDMAQWDASLEALLATGIPSLSLYRTAFIPATTAAFAKLGAVPPTAQAARLMYAHGFEKLNARGYRQPRYGCSTFSRLGYPYGLNEHRRQLLEGRAMVALGMGAYGSVAGYTYMNHRERAPYQADLAAGRLPVLSAQAVPAAERPHKYAVEAWKLGFFCGEAYARLFGESAESRFGPELETLVALGELERVGPEYRLTPQGAGHVDAIADLFVSPAARGAQ
jgi:oxygen-independent coproporphyrinogen-3 oxidase